MAVDSFEAGYGSRATARKLGLPFRPVNLLYDRWSLHGRMALVARDTKAVYSWEFKRPLLHRFQRLLFACAPTGRGVTNEGKQVERIGGNQQIARITRPILRRPKQVAHGVFRWLLTCVFFRSHDDLHRVTLTQPRKCKARKQMYVCATLIVV